MRGVCLFGGTGSRLGRYTRRVANKHLILLGDKTVADLTAERMIEAGLDNCAFVTGGNFAGQIVTYFGDGEEWGFKEITYRFQYEPDGIPSALLRTENYCKGHKIFLCLGDNVIDYNFKSDWDEFVAKGWGCKIFLTRVNDPQRFGIAEINEGAIISIEEKPEKPKSNLAIIGAYFFDESVFERAGKLKKSLRGETEVVDLMKSYLKDSSLHYCILDAFYCDVGTTNQIARVVRWYDEKSRLVNS
jgi:glucose-1-phosphate thymidylyltransferase